MKSEEFVFGLNCSRCGEKAVEYLESYSWCWECGYSPELDLIKDEQEEADLALKCAALKLERRGSFKNLGIPQVVADETEEETVCA